MQNTKFNERWLLLTLAGIQFTHILDFVIVMPLGPQFIRFFDIDSTRFGLIVSSYTFSAGLFGVIGSFFIDKFDRKSVLNTCYFGFTVGTLLCAFAENYYLLILARIVAGAFGGIINAMILAIIGDLIPYERRGKAAGIIMSAFSVATVMGVPLGLFLAGKFSWRAPFISIVILSLLILVISHYTMPSVRKHLEKKNTDNFLKKFWSILKEENHIRSYKLIATMMFAGFSVIPFISPYLISNVKISESDLSLVYFLGGAATLFTARLIGILADKYGKKQVFSVVALISLIPIITITNLPTLPLHFVLIVTTMFFIFVSSTVITAMALITVSVEPEKRV
ncbi:MAG: MFS transporter [Leptospiraceae bacterium]|nr:MFS transporter [Leptospiraceae bacterium]